LFAGIATRSRRTWRIGCRQSHDLRRTRNRDPDRALQDAGDSPPRTVAGSGRRRARRPEWVDWHNHHRLHRACDDLTAVADPPPSTPGPATGRSLNKLSLRTRRGGSHARDLSRSSPGRAADRAAGHHWRVGYPQIRPHAGLNPPAQTESTSRPPDRSHSLFPLRLSKVTDGWPQRWLVLVRVWPLDRR
jgi:hypothetical protein